MKVLVTGGTGVVGEGALKALLAHGRTVRLLGRHLEARLRAGLQASRRASETWARGGRRGRRLPVVTPSCALAGIVEEHPPDATFDRINVEGTRHVVHEAQRAGCGRVVAVSSLGADRGSSAYHRSKLQAETIVASSASTG